MAELGESSCVLDPISGKEICLIIDQIQGLYPPASNNSKPTVGSKNYLSNDNNGRIYINHHYDGTWKKDVQCIRVTASLLGQCSPGACVRWELQDPDDPSNENMNARWSKYTDANDNGAAIGNDNEGALDHPSQWESVHPYLLQDAQAQTATTLIVRNKSEVIIHCPNIAGDNLTLLAWYENPGGGQTTDPKDKASTGVMTLWHRIRLEYVRMQDALELPTKDLVTPFELCFVQMEIGETRVVSNEQLMAADIDDLSPKASAYVNSIFSHINQPGWFCLVAAMHAYPTPTGTRKQLFPDLGSTGDTNLHIHTDPISGKVQEYLELSGDKSTAGSVEITIGTEILTFDVASSEYHAGITRCMLKPHDITADFTAGDGSLEHATRSIQYFSPRFNIDRSRTHATPGGYGAGNTVKCTVWDRTWGTVSGISPSIERGKMTNGQPAYYFAGRQIVFTHHSGYRDPATGKQRPSFREQIIKTIVHEFGHGFGMPHKCGNFDARSDLKSDATGTTCCMNYNNHWMLGENGKLIPKTQRLAGSRFCARHAKEIRRTHLEDNIGLDWS